MAEREKIATAGPAGNNGADPAQPGAPLSPQPGAGDAGSRPGFSLSALFRKLFSFNALLAFLLLAAVSGTIYLTIQNAAEAPPSTGSYAVFEGDTWWHLAVGNQILATHTWPSTDPYSFSAPGDTWIAYEWLGDVMIAAANRLSGLTALTLLLLGLGTGIVLLMFYYAYLRCRNAKAAFAACALLLPLTVVSFTLRPQLLGYVFLLLTLIWLERFRQGKQKTLWLLPLLFLVWVNVHGTFAFGLAVLGLYCVSGLADFKFGQILAEPWTPKQRRHLGVVMLLSMVALTITPYGTQLAANPIEMAFFQPVNIGSFQEWRPPGFDGSYGLLLLAMILLFLLVPLLIRLEYRLEELGLLLFGVYAACVHMRFVIVFAMLFVPFLATLLTRYAPPYDADKDKPLLNLALMALIVFGCVKLFPSRATMEKVVSHGFPTGAVAYLRQHPSATPVFNKEFWGGYLINELAPQQKVFIDGRADLYEAAGVLSDYISIMRLSPDTPLLFRKYHVKSCLIRPDSPLAVLLARLPDWRRVYCDSISVIFVREAKTDQQELSAAKPPPQGAS